MPTCANPTKARPPSEMVTVSVAGQPALTPAGSGAPKPSSTLSPSSSSSWAAVIVIFRGGLVANAALDNIADAVETFCCSTERHGLRHARVVGRAGPAQIGRRDRDDDLAPGVVAQEHLDRPRPALLHDV